MAKRITLRRSRTSTALIPTEAVPVAVATPGEPGENPYVGPRPFETKDQANFFGRKQEKQQLAALVVARQIVLFYAQSGAGKTSLLQASLIPHLTQVEHIQVLPLSRVSGDVPPGLAGSQVANIYVFNTLLNMAGRPAQPETLVGLSLSQGLSSYLAGAAHSSSTQPVLLILDQFEEIFTTHPNRYAERADFFRQLQQALETYPYLSLLLAMREDYIARLDSYAAQLPDRLRTRFRMERLQYEAALDAVTEPARLAGRPFAEGVAEALVANLGGLRLEPENEDAEVPGSKGAAPVGGFAEAKAPYGQEQESVELIPSHSKPETRGVYIEPVHLQIVCHELWEKLPAGRTTIEAQDVQAFGDVDQALSRFYETALQKALTLPGLTVSERVLRRWFDTRLITPARTRGLVYRGETETEDLPNAVVDSLNNSYIIRADIRGGETWYELAHDRLVEPILAANRAWQDKYQHPLTLAAEAWRASGKDPQKLIKGDQLKEAQAQLKAQPEELTELEKEFILASEEIARRQAAKRQRFIILGAIGLMVVFAGLAIWAILSAVDAQRQKAVAETAQAEALIQATKAATAEAVARAESEEAKAARAEADAFGLAAAAIRNAQNNAELGLLLAIEAVRSTSGAHQVTVEAENALHQAISQVEQTILVPGVGQAEIFEGQAEANQQRPPQLQPPPPPPSPPAPTQADPLPNPPPLQPPPPSPSPPAPTQAEANPQLIPQLQQIQRTLSGHETPVISLAFSPDSRYLATADQAGLIKIWETASGQEYLSVTGHEGPVVELAFSPNLSQPYLVSASGDGTVKIWDITATGEMIHSLPVSTSSVIQIGFNQKGDRLVTLDAEGGAILWDTASGDQLFNLAAQETEANAQEVGINAIAFSPDGVHLATAGADGTVSIWDAYSGEAGQVWTGANPVRRLTFNRDGRYLAAASDDQSAKVWEVASGRELFTLSHNDPILYLAFSPDSAQLITVDGVGTAKVWAVMTKTELATLFNDEDQLISLAFSSDETQLRLATASLDQTTVKVWDSATTGKSFHFTGHTDRVNDLAFSPDGHWLATASDDQTVRLYQLDVQTLVAAACHLAQRNLTYDEWRTYIRGETPYRQTCKNLPAHDSAILAYVRQGQHGIEQAQELAPAGQVGTALLALAQEYAAQEAKRDDVLEVLNEAVKLDPQLKEDRTVELARVYNQVCTFDPTEALSAPTLAACHEAITLAAQAQDVRLDYEICQNGRGQEVAELVLPSCERTVDQAITAQDPSLALGVCLTLDQPEVLAPVISRACDYIAASANDLLFNSATGEFALPVEFAGSPNFNQRPDPNDISLIVMHASANSSQQGAIDWYNNPNAQTSMHYTIDKDGRIVQHVRVEDRAWHAGQSAWQERTGVNDFAIGVEFINLNDGNDPYPEEQHLAAVRLVAYLAVKYNIPVDQIVAHSDVSAGRKTDPRGYDLARLRRDVELIIGSASPPPTPPPSQPTPTIQPSVGIPVADGFDFPVGSREENVNVFDTYKIDSQFLDPVYFKSFGVWLPGEKWNGLGGGDTDLGDPVYAIAAGRVAEFGSYVDWGNVVLVEHALLDGTHVWSQYAYLDQILVEEIGQIVERGQQIGTIGKGEKTPDYPQGRFSAHLHFEIRRNNLPITNWAPMVRDRQAVMANYHAPTPFIQDHRP